MGQNKGKKACSEHPFSELIPIFWLFGGMVVFLAILFYFHYQKLNNEGMIQRQEIHKKAQKIANANKRIESVKGGGGGSSHITGGSSLLVCFVPQNV